MNLLSQGLTDVAVRASSILYLSDKTRGAYVQIGPCGAMVDKNPKANKKAKAKAAP